MSISSDEITIAVTVFNRRKYLKQAIASALDQTAPVHVMVVEDCGPDPGLETFVREAFGSRIEYIRNPQRRGLFGNWNACVDYCQTPWLSLLHDDDYLAPCFAQSMIELSAQAPGCGLYYGTTEYVSEAGEPLALDDYPPMTTPWRRVELAETLRNTPMPFPGHVFRVDHVRELGGFQEGSQFCGDWEMWAKLIARYGAAQTRTNVAFKRANPGAERGCTKIDLNGRLRPLVFVQQKRVLRLLRESGADVRFDRAGLLKEAPMSIGYLLEHGVHLPSRILRYNVGLMLRSPAPNTQYAVFQTLARGLGWRFVRTASRLKGWLKRQRPSTSR
jgi:glycosyltransferase involved in cell wall biosynthesis